jgi:hypothetical protein
VPDLLVRRITREVTGDDAGGTGPGSRCLYTAPASREAPTAPFETLRVPAPSTGHDRLDSLISRPAAPHLRTPADRRPDRVLTYAGHNDRGSNAGVITTYVRADVEEIAGPRRIDRRATPLALQLPTKPGPLARGLLSQVRHRAGWPAAGRWHPRDLAKVQLGPESLGYLRPFPLPISTCLCK